MIRRLSLRAGVATLTLSALLLATSAGGSEPRAGVSLNSRTSVDLRGQTLRDALAFLAQVAHVEIEAAWAENDGRAGLDPEANLTLRLKNATVVEAVERILAALPSEEGDEATWQVSPAGGLEVGPRSRLNHHHRVEVYPIADLINSTPNFPSAPTIDLAAALQPDSGTIFKEEEAPPRPSETAETPAERLVRLLTSLIEPAQWRENGGEGASIQVFRDTLVVDAPEYIHRQIAGRVNR